ncbi:MAG: dethiobiotin synthase, partial [Thermodesulfobacteriota bacterium]
MTVLVTGTDTGVGKTYVACGLARAAVAAGWRIAVRKPAETGCERDASGTLVPGDAVALRAAAGAAERLDEVCAVRL